MKCILKKIKTNFFRKTSLNKKITFPRKVKSKSKINKKAVSLMLSYVLLISIVLVVSIGVFTWLKLIINIEPVTDCKEGTSLILEDIICGGKMELLLKNNGRFSVDGVTVTIGDNASETPIYFLVPHVSGGYREGHYLFEDELKPGKSSFANFTDQWRNWTNENARPEKIGFEYIKTVKIQPYIISRGEIVHCSEGVIEQDIQACRIT